MYSDHYSYYREGRWGKKEYETIFFCDQRFQCNCLHGHGCVCCREPKLFLFPLLLATLNSFNTRKWLGQTLVLSGALKRVLVVVSSIILNNFLLTLCHDSVPR